jgi:hypothetical protein
MVGGVAVVEMDSSELIVAVPVIVSDAGMKLQVMSAGSAVAQAKVSVPAYPYTGAVAILTLAAVPAVTVYGEP